MRDIIFVVLLVLAVIVPLVIYLRVKWEEER
jgi:hypothetical protein